MAEFETIESECVDFGGFGFIEFSLKRVTEGQGDAGNVFGCITRGFYLKDKTPRRRNFITVPDNPEVWDFIARAAAARAAVLRGTATPAVPASPEEPAAPLPTPRTQATLA